MSTPSNSGLRRLVECDKRNSPLPSLSNAPTVGDTASEAQADEPLAVQADFPNDGDDDDDDDNYDGLDFKRVPYLERRQVELNVSRATITNLINQAYDPSSIAANNLSEILLRLQAAKEIAEYEKDALRAALHVHQKPRNRHEPPLDLQQRKAQLVKEKEKEKELLDKIELKEAKENNRIYQLKIKEAARAAREEAKKVRDEAKAVKAAELDAKRRDRDAAKAIQQP
ncbi:hypothetical protein Ptr86124_004448 [Pyrenophora tritici-repentis]|uniref:TolA, Membrane protein involved in colicin uptake n=1 Tax=Pyrenophora tritici-repentis TaxID=45151 RepID=A0A922NKY0_9PLEO|nr:hypothetical protein Ptr86124_004448 [Pyrenophora tritici-repentis]